MRNPLFVLMLIACSARCPGQDTKIEVQRSAGAKIINGNHNTMSIVDNSNNSHTTITYNFSSTPTYAEIVNFLQKVNKGLGYTMVDPKYEVVFASTRAKVYFVKNLQTDKFAYLVNVKNHLLIDLAAYQFVQPDTLSGLHVVEVGYGFGFINDKGQYVVAPHYSKVRPFLSRSYTIVEAYPLAFGIVGKDGSLVYPVDTAVRKADTAAGGVFFFSDILDITYRFDPRTRQLDNARLFGLVQRIDPHNVSRVTRTDSTITIHSMLGDEFVYSTRRQTLDREALFLETLNFSPHIFDMAFYGHPFFYCEYFERYFTYSAISYRFLPGDGLAVIKSYRYLPGEHLDGRDSGAYEITIYNRRTRVVWKHQLAFTPPRFQPFHGRLLFNACDGTGKQCPESVDYSLYSVQDGNPTVYPHIFMDTITPDYLIVHRAEHEYSLLDSAFIGASPKFYNLRYSGYQALFFVNPYEAAKEGKNPEWFVAALFDATAVKTLSPAFAELQPFVNGFAVYRDRWVKKRQFLKGCGYLKPDGTQLPGTYAACANFGPDGTAVVTKDGRQFTIDHTGQVVSK